MDDDFQATIADGGPWAKGEPGIPAGGPISAKAELKIILPGAPDRLNVPKPAEVPWSGIGLLNCFLHGDPVLAGSGFLCQPDIFVTAKHNLTAKQYDAAGIWMAYDGQSNPHVPPIGIKAFATHKSLDLAVLVLATPQYGTFDLGGDLPPAHAGVALAGYGFRYPNAAQFSYAIGAVKGADANRIAYAINTREGDSGAPVFTVVDGVPRALGVHTEAETILQAGNSGVRLTPPIIADLYAMIAWARAQIGGY